MIKKLFTQLKPPYLLADWAITPAWFLIPLMFVAALMNGYLMIKNPNIGGDALQYHSVFHNFIAGKGWTNYDGVWLPVEAGYGLLSYLFFLVIKDIEYSGMLVSSVSYLAMIPTTYLAVKYLFGKRSALLASFLIAFWPTLLSYSYINLTDSVFTFLLLLGFLLYSRVLLGNRSVLGEIFLGFVLGLAYLTREPEGFFVSILVLLSLFLLSLWYWIRYRRGAETVYSWHTFFLTLRVGAFGFLIILFANSIFIYTQTGIWSISIKTMGDQKALSVTVPLTDVTEFFEANHQSILDEDVNTSNANNVDLFAMVRQYMPLIVNPLTTVDELAFALARVNAHAFVPLALLWGVFPFLSKNSLNISLYFVPRKLKKLLAFAIFASPIILHAMLPNRYDNRYVMAYSVFVIIGASVLSVKFLDTMFGSWGRDNSDIGLLLLCFLALIASLFFGSPTLPQVLTEPHDHRGLRAAGIWLSDHVQEPQNLNIITTKKGAVILFYASGKTFEMGRSLSGTSLTLEEISSLIKSREYDYLVLEPQYIAASGKLLSLWDNPELAQGYGLFLLYKDSSGLFQVYAGSSITP